MERRVKSPQGHNKIPFHGLARSATTALAVITLAGLSLRLFWAVSHAERSQPDETGYHALAEGLASRGEYGSLAPDGSWKPTAHYPPAWPFMVSLSYRLGGTDVRTGRVLAAALGTLLIIAVFLLAKNIFGEKAGLIAAALAAVHPILIYWSGVMMTESATALFLCLALWIETRPGGISTLSGFITGIFWGTASLTRSTLIPVFFLLGLARLFRPGTLKEKTPVLALFLGFALLPFLWGTRNSGVFGRFGLDFHGGYTLLVGNMFFSENRVDTGLADAALKSRPWHKETENMNEAEKDRYYLRRTLEFVVSNPGKVLRQWVVNAGEFWRLYPRQDHPMPHNKKFLMLVSLAAEVPLFALALAGLWLKRKQLSRWLVLLIPFIVLTAAHCVSVSQMRYRLPLTPLMIVFAAAALAGPAGGTAEKKEAQ